jgi:signal transduction histidine kinase
MQSASNKIEGVIRRVMDFSKPSTPKLTMMDLNETIESAIELASTTLRKSGIEVEKSLDQNLAKCFVDGSLMEQVFLNIITNAMEAMKGVSGSKKLRITSSNRKDYALISISDSGSGIPSEIRDKIFDPFYTTKSDGSGIGLSLCHRIVTDHGGALEVSTSQWGGAEFRIEIPFEKRRSPR